MDYLISGYDPTGECKVCVPTSKSIAARALIISSLSPSPTPIKGLPDNDDIRVLRDALAKIDSIRHSTSNADSPKGYNPAIQSSDSPEESNLVKINLGASGTALRLLTAVCAATDGLHVVLTGTDRLLSRPMDVLIDALLKIGADIMRTDEGYEIRGTTLSGGTLEVAGNISSQFITALLLIAPCCSNPLTIRTIGDIVSWSYINMTIKMMQQFGVEADVDPFGSDLVLTVSRGYKSLPKYDVEVDWSGVTFFYELAAILGEKFGKCLYVNGLGDPDFSIQGDAECADIFAELGVDSGDDVRGRYIESYDVSDDDGEIIYDMRNTPDMVPALAVTLALQGHRWALTGIEHLHHKESDRIATVAEGLRRLGCDVFVGDDYMSGTGEIVPQKSIPQIDTYADHRIAMAFAIAGVKLSRGVVIRDVEVVNKSFPGFWEQLRKIGVIFEEIRR